MRFRRKLAAIFRWLYLAALPSLDRQIVQAFEARQIEILGSDEMRNAFDLEVG